MDLSLICFHSLFTQRRTQKGKGQGVEGKLHHVRQSVWKF